ncbi:MAG: hypothetical protein IJ560_04140 [Alphaproteobacteria bacterium]|nr:hypothetical protein [Alphaproteobacteria bacterium]
MKTFFTPNRLLRCHAIFFVVCVQFCIGGTARAATCDAGYWLDNTGTCKLCDVRYACPGNDERVYCANLPGYAESPGATECTPCPEILPKYQPYLKSMYYYLGDNNEKVSVDGCRVILEYKNYDHIQRIEVNCYYSPDVGGYTETSKSDSSKCMASVYSCDAGYYSTVGRDTYEINGVTVSYGFRRYWQNGVDNILKKGNCIPVGYGHYQIINANGYAYERAACSIGTYTATDTAAAESDCMPCTNAPANAHYTAANTTDGTPNCEWECDDGFGHTSDDRCLPLCRIGDTAMNGINIYAEKHTKYAMAVPRAGATCWINATRDNGGKLVPVN